RVYSPDGHSGGTLAAVLRVGRPRLIEPHEREWQSGVQATSDQREAVAQLGPESIMLLPLVARGRTLGLMSLVAAESGRHYDQRDLLLAEELARRCALAVDNARLYAAAEQALHEANAAVRVRDEVLATVSHDLKTPLT